ncbi:DUF2238 domain-containing protein [Nitrospira sp. Nam74]
MQRSRLAAPHSSADVGVGPGVVRRHGDRRCGSEDLVGANILPVLFVSVLVTTHRRVPLSNASYVLITVWLTLHTVAVHYTYPKVPFGIWLDQWFDFHRNHFDRIVHFSFGSFLTLPLVEVFRRRCNAKGVCRMGCWN